MAVLEIVRDGDPVLKKSCKKIRKVTDDLRRLAGDMVDTLVANGNGVGLSANQVSHGVRMIAVWNGDAGTDVFLNPRITKWSDEIEYSTEGCLSFPDLFGTVGRSYEVEVVAQDFDMKKVKVKAEGFRARIFQHEIDHLNGITFVERVEDGTLHEISPDEIDGEETDENDGVEIDEIDGEETESDGKDKEMDNKPADSEGAE